MYLQPNLTSCNCFYWLMLWISFVKLVHYCRPMDLDDYIFPVMGAAGIIQPHALLSHNAVQNWIDKAVLDAKITISSGRNFMMHTYCWGGAQHQYMFAPVRQCFTLAKVHWWGRWAKNKQVRGFPIMQRLPQFLIVVIVRHNDSVPAWWTLCIQDRP